MHIVSVVHGWMPKLAAGSERAMQHVLDFLRNHGHDITVVSLDTDVEYLYDKIKVVPPETEFDHIDIVIAHHAPGATVGAALAGQHNVPFVLYTHNERLNIEHLDKTKPNFVIHNTAWVRDALQNRQLLVATCTVVHPPVEPHRHYVEHPGGDVTLINLSANKGVDLFYKLASEIPDMRFLGVQGSHGEQRLEGSVNVSIQLTTQDMRDVWKRTAVLLVPSEYESYGMVAAEACVSGIPVIAHPTPGLVECLGEAGIFVDRNDVEGYKRELRRLTDPDEYAKASGKAKQRLTFFLEQSERELNELLKLLTGLQGQTRPPMRWTKNSAHVQSGLPPTTMARAGFHLEIL